MSTILKTAESPGVFGATEQRRNGVYVPQENTSADSLEDGHLAIIHVEALSHSQRTSSSKTMVMKITASEAGVPLLGAVGPRYVFKQATVKRCVLLLLLISIASIFYYTHYIISSGPLSR